MFRWLRRIGLAVLVLLCVSHAALASSTAMIMVSGAEQQRFDQSWDVGPIQISFNGFTETIYYGQFSTPASIASAIGGQFTRDFARSGLCAHATGTIVTFVLSGTQTFSTLMTADAVHSFALSNAGFATPAVPPASSPAGGPLQVSTWALNMTGGWDAGTFYDSGNVTVQVSGATAQVEWVEGTTPASLASTIASAINTAAGGFVSASPSGNTVYVTSLTDGPAADMSITGSVADTNPDYFTTPSFSVTTQNMAGGAFSAGSPLYSFVIPEQSGYDLNGNLLTATDSVMGQWNYAYDNLNRLVQGSAPVSQPTGVNAYYAGVQPSWTYDAFGNRLTETQGAIAGAHPTASMPTSSTATYTAASNQLVTSTMASAILYDAAGDITFDGNNYYLYDAEGRLCAVNNAGTLTGYVYDASGIRVAKGSLASFSCNFASTNFTTTTSWVLGPAGEQVTEYSVNSGASTWQHTNAFASGALLASYHDTDTYFALEDWLGTKRAEISAGGQIANYRSLPYGNGLVSTGTAVDATEHHFTGKERDAESGNDYFEARYYSSNLGRFMSPDWSAKEEPVPYAKTYNPQSLNLYSYVLNHPTTGIDPDGHDFQQQANQNWIADHQITNSTNEQLQSAGLVRQSAQAQQQNATTTVTLNNRQANIPGGALLDAIGIDHQWISTPDGTAVGMGTAQGVPQSDAPGVQTQVVNHAGEVATSTQTFTGVDTAALGTYTKVGTPTGRWVPGVNDCNTWAYNVIHQSTPHDIYAHAPVITKNGVQFGPVAYHNVVVYADGSIHSPGAQ